MQESQRTHAVSYYHPVYSLDVFCCFLYIKHRCFPGGVFPDFTAHFHIREAAYNCRCKRTRILRFDQQPVYAIIDQFRNTTHIRGNHDISHSHIFKDGHTKGLTERGRDDNVCSPVNTWHVGILLGSHKKIFLIVLFSVARSTSYWHIPVLYLRRNKRKR